MERRDLVVIGTSAGGVDALPKILAPLPTSFPCAILIVQHMAEQADPLLVSILQRSSQLRVAWAGQGDRLEPGQVLVAPPGTHMTLLDDHVQLRAGPRERHVRPSIDRLFNSVAERRGARAIGVILTGMLDDGGAGLAAIQAAGGYTIVQDPLDAAYPEMPTHALQAMTPDRVLAIEAISAALVTLVSDGPAEARR